MNNTYSPFFLFALACCLFLKVVFNVATHSYVAHNWFKYTHLTSINYTYGPSLLIMFISLNASGCTPKEASGLQNSAEGHLGTSLLPEASEGWLLWAWNSHSFLLSSLQLLGSDVFGRQRGGRGKGSIWISPIYIHLCPNLYIPNVLSTFLYYES